MPRSSGRAGAADRRLLEALRRRGVRGGVIGPHRAMVGLPLTAGRAASALFLAALMLGAVRLCLPLLAAAWGGLFEAAAPWLGLPGAVELQPVSLGPLGSLTLPRLTAEAGWPTDRLWFGACAATGAVLVASLILPQRLLPVSYLLRALAAVQASAIVYFAAASGPFPYRLADYGAGQLAAGVVVLHLVPVLFALTLYPLDLAWAKKGLLTVLTLGHLAVFLPLQALAHAALIHRFSYLVLPLLFFVFGLLVDILIVVAFYGWGMSWVGRGEGGA